MSDSRDGGQRVSQKSSYPPMAAAASPLPSLRENQMRGSADVQRLPSLQELLPDLGEWQPENAAHHRGYLQGARGPRDFPGRPSIPPSPTPSSLSRDNFSSPTAPAQLSPQTGHPSPSSSTRSSTMLPPVQPMEQRPGFPPLIYGQAPQPPQVRDVDPRGFHGQSAASSPGYYPAMPQAREFGGPMGPPQGPGYPPSAPPGHGMGYESMGDYNDAKRGRRRGNLPKPVTDILRMWFQDHVAHPYPTEEEKQHLMHQTGLTISQISNWFINARRRSLPRMTGQGQTDTDLH